MKDGHGLHRPLLEVRDIKVHRRLRRSRGGPPLVVKAVDGVSFDVNAGETLGLVGESGCGKTSLLRTIVGLLPATGGRVLYDGKDHTGTRRPSAGGIQMVFQDPQSSLNPRRRIGAVLADSLRIAGVPRSARRDKVVELLGRVGLSGEHVDRFPHAFSGGQRQRIGIARAIGAGPRLIALDEPMSSLDVSIQAQIANLLHDLQAELGLTYLFVSHDLAVVRQIAHRVAVMYLGKIVELGTTETVLGNPSHPYTRALMAASPIPDIARRRHRPQPLGGEPASPINPPSGCAFRTRCPHAMDICKTLEPKLSPQDGHLVACHLARDAMAGPGDA